MNYENKKIVILCSIMIVLLLALSFNRINRVDFNYDYSLMPEMPEIKTPDLDEMMSGIDTDAIEKIINREIDIEGLSSEELTSIVVKKENVGDYKEVILNNQISLEYPSDWIRSESNVVVDHPDMDVLLFAFSLDLEFPTTVVGLKLNLEEIEQVEEFMREVSEQQGTTMLIKDKKYLEDNILQFEAEYNYTDGRVAVSKERAIKVDDNYYLISVIALNTKVKSVEEQINYIFDSIKVI